MNQTNNAMLAIFLALGVVLVVGLVILPAIHEAQARSSTALDRYKGHRGDDASNGKRQGYGGIDCGVSCG